ncbi:MAG: peptide chain release factor N(5)-glutamine methyltransferase [Treponema sp.]|nr:peptide chain release factor N(5)-glutamine methyltransferase [Treponema sp.]
MTVQQALARAAARLKEAGIDSPVLDASLLLGEALGLDRARLLLAYPQPLPADAEDRLNSMLDRRLAGDCAAYILGRKEFRGLDFLVNPAVLVPRPDTETLVEAALDCLNQEGGSPPLRAGQGPALPPQRGAGPSLPGGPPQRPPTAAGGNAGLKKKRRLLDLCTGSGAVAAALKHEAPDLEVVAADISPEALETARRNAERLLGPAAVAFVLSDLFDRIPGRFHLITANPPYVETGAIPGLPVEVRREPRLALDGGPDGLLLIRRIIAGAPERLHPGGRLLLEADPRQIKAVAAELAGRGFGDIQIYRDLSGAERVIGGGV